MAKQGRQFTIVDVPDPIEIKAEFVYNFFVSDERVNDSGDPRVPGAYSAGKTQRLVNQGTLQLEVPRYVDINFKPAQTVDFNNFGDGKDNFQLEELTVETDISAEEEMTNDAYASINESDPNATFRLTEKLEMLSSVMDLDFSESDQSTMLSAALGVLREPIQKLLSPYGKSEDLRVNIKPSIDDATMYDIAGQLSLNTLVSKRVIGVAAMGGDDTSPLSGIGNQELAQSIADDFLATAEQFDLTEADTEATILPSKLPEEVSPQEEARILGVSTVGYVLTRRQLGPSGKVKEACNFPISGKDNTRFLDDNIIYGSKYVYAVRTVYQLDAIVGVADKQLQQKYNADTKLSADGKHPQRKFRISTLIASRPCPAVTVTTEEYEPPLPPDGLFYNFNYDRGRGLILTWQLPAGRSRDVKFFQIFRRASIYEPFQCIAELDFDDSVVRTNRPERVRPDLVIPMPGPAPLFEDRTFQRDSGRAIYAVCAIDAHGYTSGYSTQTLVGFNKISNTLTLKNVSRPGAPKQYPNLYIDPDLDDNIAVDSFTQDAIFDSGHTRMDIYFTPDALTTKMSGGNTSNAVSTSNQQGVYKAHILNLDLQKAAIVASHEI